MSSCVGRWVCIVPITLYDSLNRNTFKAYHPLLLSLLVCAMYFTRPWPGLNCERSEQSLTKGERPGQTNTNWWPKMSIRKYLEWRVSQQVSILFPQNLWFRWGLIAFTLIWAKIGVFIPIFTIILEYKNWAANTWCKSLEHRLDEYARKYFWYCAVCNYGVDRSL